MPPPLYLGVHLRDFAAQALAGTHPELRSRAVAVLRGDPPLERVFAMNPRARCLGLEPGMSRVQAESFPVVALRRDRPQEDVAFAELMRCAGKFSPRIENIASPQEEACGATLLLDVSGSERLLGDARQIATTLRQSVYAMEYEASVVASHHAYTAVLAARGMAGATAIAPGREAEALAPLPIAVLQPGDEQAQIFADWGIHTLGQLAALPARPLAARLGQGGLRLQAQARGEYSHLLVPAEEPADAPLCESMELEHPVELLEPLLFLLGRMLEQVTGRAARRSLAIASVELCLLFDGNALERNRNARSPDANPVRRSRSRSEDRLSHSEDRRTVRPAIPERDHLTLLKLLQLELELHPPAAAVVALRIAAHPARRKTAQPGLFEAMGSAQPLEAGRMEILLARLRKLVGEGRVGAPQLLDSYAPEAFRVVRFDPGVSDPRAVSGPVPATRHAPALRMVRPPRAVAIELRGNAPAAMQYEGARHIVQASSGPWRSSGAWWTHPAWCREEWDVVLKEPPQRCLRLAHDPGSGGWYVIGLYD